jgi:hypothetical protein
MVLLKRKRILAAKIETTTGTAETLAAADAAFNAYNVTIQTDIEKTPREGQGSLGHLFSATGGHKGKVTFSIDLGWDGTSTEPAWADTFLPACGLVKSTNTFRPSSTVPISPGLTKTLTIGVYEDGIFKSIRGASGNMKLNCEAGKMVTAEFEFSGIWVAPTDVALITPTYPVVAPLRYARGVTTFSGAALQCQTVTLDLANTVTYRESVSATSESGYISTVITNRRPTVTVNPEAKLVAGRDDFGQFLASTEAALVFEIGGPTTSKIVFTAPKASLESIAEGDRNMLQTNELTFLCGQNGSTADQEIELVFTP